jgi:hypothetical protein
LRNTDIRDNKEGWKVNKRRKGGKGGKYKAKEQRRNEEEKFIL